jgi:arylsulfatase A-like enzyme
VRAEREDMPLFATMLSVSNHRPYAVPPGRTDRPAGERSRAGAIRYADFCLGRYLDRARASGLLEHTVVLVVGDHGARVYGSEAIPVRSYRIPGLFLAPDPALRGRRLDVLASQIDLAPTLLSLAGRACEAPFFGTDLLRNPEAAGRAFVHHDRDVGLLTEDTLVVLGLKKTTHVYTRVPGNVDAFELVPDAARTPAQEGLVSDAIAVFQTADELYRAGRFELRPSAPADPLPRAGPSR